MEKIYLIIANGTVVYHAASNRKTAELLKAMDEAQHKDEHFMIFEFEIWKSTDNNWIEEQTKFFKK